MGLPGSLGRLGPSRRVQASVVLLVLLSAGGLICFLNSKGHRDSVNAKASQKFGEALERAGITTQATPSE